jgi:hypothetical protein
VEYLRVETATGDGNVKRNVEFRILISLLSKNNSRTKLNKNNIFDAAVCVSFGIWAFLTEYFRGAPQILYDR